MVDLLKIDSNEKAFRMRKAFFVIEYAFDYSSAFFADLSLLPILNDRQSLSLS